MNGLTAADFADTGQWRLIVEIYRTGIRAHIENTIHEDLEPQLLFVTEWEADSDHLLRNIENAVYDHPRVLDDFSARIIVYDRKTMFFPTEFANHSDETEDECYASVCGCDAADVMTDVDSDLIATHCLVAGLKGFLNRTFPGAKIESNLMSKVRCLRKEGEGRRLVMEVRDQESDFILLDGDNLLSASTHSVSSPEDVVYHALNILDVYGLTINGVVITATGSVMAEKASAILAAVAESVNA